MLLLVLGQQVKSAGKGESVYALRAVFSPIHFPSVNLFHSNTTVMSAEI